MSISASMVKELRDKTAAGMMDCKKALEAANGDMEKAIDWLREKGLAKAAKKAGRTTSEGLIGLQIDKSGGVGIIVEVKCETDFVARGDKFQELVKNLSSHVMLNASEGQGKGESLLDESYVADPSRTVQAALQEAIATIGENIVLGRFVKMRINAGAKGIIGSYLHSNRKLAVLVEIQVGNEAVLADEKFKDLAKNIAMQVAASAPLAVDKNGLDPAMLDREREIYRQKARDEGKKEQIIEKIVEGAVNKYCKEVCLIDQPYIRDDKISIGNLIKGVAKELNTTISVARFVRIQLGAE